MRPVNLIPREDRAGELRPLRSGPLAYIVVAALLAVLAGVTALVITSNEISERKAEVVELEAEKSTAEARAQSLAAYTQFDSVRQARVATISSLADSRFDWERVMRELALVLPDDVWLTNLTASASPAVAPEGATSISLRSGVAGPALELTGCGRSQDAVAGFIVALKDIDGVTRVGVQSSKSASGESSGGESASTATCQTRKSFPLFQIVVAFDAAPVPPEATTEGAVVPAPEEEAPAEGEEE